MSQSKRVFQFEGSDNDYIAFLKIRLPATLNQGTSQTFISSATSLYGAQTTISLGSQPSTSTTTLADSFTLCVSAVLTAFSSTTLKL
ncbi:hypothetical protein N7465_002941 [Penicillium sp. CMV-2018d]|nr:hypothetical protein N7465_002941 [Penicillium sp. CMV-2018d]